MTSADQEIVNPTPTAPAEPKLIRISQQMTKLGMRYIQMVHLAERSCRYGGKCAGWPWGACVYWCIFWGKLALDRPFGHLANLQLHPSWLMHRHMPKPCHMLYLVRWDKLVF